MATYHQQLHKWASSAMESANDLLVLQRQRIYQTSILFDLTEPTTDKTINSIELNNPIESNDRNERTFHLIDPDDITQIDDTASNDLTIESNDQGNQIVGIHNTPTMVSIVIDRTNVSVNLTLTPTIDSNEVSESALTSSHCVTATVTSSSFSFPFSLCCVISIAFPLCSSVLLSLSNVFEMLVALEDVCLCLPSREK